MEVKQDWIQPLVVTQKWNFNKRRLQALQSAIVIPEINQYMETFVNNPSKVPCSPSLKLQEIMQKIRDNYIPYKKISYRSFFTYHDVIKLFQEGKRELAESIIKTQDKLRHENMVKLLDQFALSNDMKNYFAHAASLLRLNNHLDSNNNPKNFDAPITSLQDPRDPSGKKILTDPLEIAQVLTEHFRPQFEDPKKNGDDDYDDDQTQNQPQLPQLQLQQVDLISSEELYEALKLINLDRAIAIDLIADSILKGLTPNSAVFHFMLLCINEFLTSSTIPEWISCRRMIYLDKNALLNQKNNTPPQITSLRGIAIGSVFIKCMEAIVLKRLLSPPIDVLSKLAKNQIGFIPTMNTSIHILMLVGTLLYRQQQKQPCYITFYDFKSAYDKVCHQKLFQKLVNNFGVDHQTMHLIKILYKCSKVQIGGILPKGHKQQSLLQPIQVCRGVLQGSLISPLLFNIYLDDLMKQLEAEKGIKYAAYADDLYIYADNYQELKNGHQIVMKWCLENDMEVGENKTRCFTFIARTAPKTKENRHFGIAPFTNIQKYLGMMIDSRLTLQEFIKQYGGKLHKYLIGLPKIQLRLLSIHSRIRLWKTYAFTHLNYACCVLALHNTAFNRFKNIYYNSIKLALGLDLNSSNKRVVFATGIWTATLTVHYNFLKTVVKLKEIYKEESLPPNILATQAQLIKKYQISQQDLANLKKFFHEWFLTKAYKGYRPIYQFPANLKGAPSSSIHRNFLLFRFWCDRLLNLYDDSSSNQKQKKICPMCTRGLPGSQQHYLDSCSYMEKQRDRVLGVLYRFSQEYNFWYPGSLYQLCLESRCNTYSLPKSAYLQLVQILSDYIEACHTAFTNYFHPS